MICIKKLVKCGLQLEDKFNFFFEDSCRNTTCIRVSNGLGSDQDGHFFGPDLGPNCYQQMKEVAVTKEITMHTVN